MAMTDDVDEVEVSESHDRAGAIAQTFSFTSLPGELGTTKSSRQK